MIDKAYQNRGYGKEAVSLALEFIKSMPCGEAEYCWLSYEPDNAVARQMYRSFGFEETGEMDGEELIAVLRLQLTTSSFYNNHINPHFLFDCNMIWFSRHPKHSHPQT